MAKPWDDVMKQLFATYTQHFLNWLLPGAQIDHEMSIVLKSRTLETDALHAIILNGIRMILHVEFQRRSDADMGKRLWEYNTTATITSGLTVYSIVIYLRKDRKIVESPYERAIPTGEVVHIFYFRNIKLWELPTEFFKQPGLEGLLPLMPLTKDGQRPEVVEDMVESLVASQKTDLLSIAYLLASLVFEKKDEREWLDRRFAMYQDILRESWVYQGILREGLEEGREQGLEEGRAEGRAEGREEGREEGIQALRQTLVSFMEIRFPALAPLTRQQISGIKDSDVLKNVTIKLFSVQTSSEAEQYLLTLGDDAKKN